MRRLPALALVAALLAGCASHGAVADGHAISGSVLAGPTCPVARADSPCPPAPWTGTVRATGSDGTTHDAQTDANGAFSIVGLPSGTYTLQALTTGVSRAAPVTVRLDGTDRTVTLQVDTGLR